MPLVKRLSTETSRRSTRFPVTVELLRIVVEFLPTPSGAPIGISFSRALTAPSLPLIRLALALERLEFRLADGFVETVTGIAGVSMGMPSFRAELCRLSVASGVTVASHSTVLVMFTAIFAPYDSARSRSAISAASPLAIPMRRPRR
jgi:hypothetical protein